MVWPTATSPTSISLEMTTLLSSVFQAHLVVRPLGSLFLRSCFATRAISNASNGAMKFAPTSGKTPQPLHFKNLKHNQRIVAASVLSKKFIRATSILAYKPIIPAGIYNTKNQLYFYLTRYLIERVSWLCRDLRRMVTEGDGRVKIVFSRRGGMSYPDFQAYLGRLQTDQTVRIHWPVIDIVGVEALDHPRRAGLQLADIIASSFGAAVEPNLFGNCEWRYAETLKPVIYHRKHNYFSYGVKAFPKFDDVALTNDQQRFVALFQ